jgi:hypothetical protein
MLCIQITHNLYQVAAEISLGFMSAKMSIM